MTMQRGWLSCAALLGALLVATSCSSDGGTPVAPGAETVFPDSDALQEDVAGATDVLTPPRDVPDGGCPAGAPEGHATIRFAVDDSARRTFADGEMIWTGSFRLDDATNVVEFSASWLPTDGPFPLLYDDGPRSACGHEQPDAVAGDHVFTTEVYYLAAETRTIEYGLLNELSNWMWIGRNGTLEIPAASTDVFEVPGMTIPPCGSADLKVTLDLAQLQGDYVGEIKGWDGETAPTHDVYVKGTLNMWTNVLLVDNGKRGDAEAHDGVYTFVLSENLGKHDCLLLAGDHPQFVFAFARPEQAPDLEYKDAGQAALPDGVQAWVDPNGDGAWQDADVILEPASDGVRQNTTVVIPGSEQACASDTDCSGEKAHCVAALCVPCYDDSHCAGGTCERNRCEGGSTPDCSADEDCDEAGRPFCEAGSCVECRSADQCGDGFECRNFGCVEVVEPDCSDTKPCTAGFCAEGHCVECRTDEDCDEDERCQTDRCVLGGTGEGGPLVFQLIPAVGPKSGGTLVTIKGLNFEAGLSVLFGEATATDVTVVSDQELTCKSPAGAVGRIDVTVRGADGTRDTFYGGFYYFDEGDGPQISAVVPNQGPSTGGSPVAIRGTNFSEGAQVRFGNAVATATRASAEELRATVPPGTAGSVDVTVLNANGLSATCAACYTYVDYELRGTPTVDGTLGSDWPANHLVAENDVPSSWGPNVLEKLHVAFDDQNLYVGIEGSAEPGNAIVAYLDVDAMAANGIDGASGCWDNDGELDDALCVTMDEQSAGPGAGSLYWAPSGAKVDLAFGTRGMASYAPDAECSNLGESASTGWRRVGGLPDQGNLDWLCGHVVTGTNAVEAAIPLATLYPGGLPAGGADLALFVRLVSGEGNFISNQALPSLFGSDNVYEVSGVVRFRVD